MAKRRHKPKYPSQVAYVRHVLGMLFGRPSHRVVVEKPRFIKPIPLRAKKASDSLRADVESALRNLGHKAGAAKRAATGARGLDFDSLFRSAQSLLR